MHFCTTRFLRFACVAVLVPLGAFAKNPEVSEELPPSSFPSEKTLVIQAVGDLMLAAAAEATMQSKGFDFAFQGTNRVLQEGDLNIANLETPITTRGTPQEKTFTFRQHPDSLAALLRAKIGLVALANNHAGDFGEVGFLDTLQHLDASGIAHAGVGKNSREARKPAVVNVKGRKVGMLSYSLTFPKEFYATDEKPGTPFGHETHIREDVRKARSEVDILLVSFHWGAELMKDPKPYQRQLGRVAIESGADAVIGTHPHVLQGIELIDGKPIFYSLGNFAFGSNSRKTGRSVIARLVFSEKNEIVAVEARPINVLNAEVAFNPRLAEGELAASIASELATLSQVFRTTIVFHEGWARVVLGSSAKNQSKRRGVETP